MRSLERRLEQMETLYGEPEDKKPKGAYVAIIDTDGSVKVSHKDFDDFTLPNKEALDTWIEENGLNDDWFIRVIIVDNNKHKDEPQPKEL